MASTHTSVAVRRTGRSKGRATSVSATVVPATARDISNIARECRKLVTRRALIAAGAAVVPLPGVDIAADISVLMRMIEQVNERFGLTPEQIEQLAPQRKLFAYKAAMGVGSALIGRMVTRGLVIRLLKTMGMRMTAKQAAKYVPFAGQAIAASVSFAAIKRIGDRHVEDCVRVAETLIELSDDNVVASY